MNTDKRSIVRKRTQQLVYVELGRDNGGVMLNLSEEGCGFQAISPVKLGETRFAFQISGGRRIAGEAQTVWVDDIGIMGGLRFVDMDPQPRQEIRKWLAETNAPDELGDGVLSAAASPPDTIAQGSRFRAGAAREESAAPIPKREYHQNSWPQSAAAARTEPFAASPSWGGTFTGNPALVEDVPRLPVLQDDPAYGGSHRKSLALWRGIAAIAMAAAVGALLVAYQHDVGRSLIWLGETLSGKTKASVVTPQNAPEQQPAQPTLPATDISTPAEKAEAGAIPAKQPDQTQTVDTEPAKADAGVGNAGGVQPESLLERQVAHDKAEPFNGTATVESLWAAVQSGSVSAELSLAERFARGDGVAQNCDQAKVLLRAASRRGSREATLKLYQLESEGCRGPSR